MHAKHHIRRLLLRSSCCCLSQLIFVAIPRSDAFSTHLLTHQLSNNSPLCTKSNHLHQQDTQRTTVLSMDTSDQNYNLAQNSEEIFDIYPSPPSPSHHNCVITSAWGDAYYPSPRPTGKTKTRRSIHQGGDWHRSVQIWLVQKVGDKARVLLQRRSPYKDTHPNLLDVSCAGHVDSGEDVMECALRELQEELGGRGAIQYTCEDLENAKAFVVTSSIKGKTQQFGSFLCNEYQNVFILWWDDDQLMEEQMFAPMNSVEVAGFEIVDGAELIERMRGGDEDLVPRSEEYVNALAEAFGIE